MRSFKRYRPFWNILNAGIIVCWLQLTFFACITGNWILCLIWCLLTILMLVIEYENDGYLLGKDKLEV